MDNKFDKLSVSNGVTYVAGLGFISPNNNRQIIDEINKLSNVISASLILYFFCQKIFIMPATYLTGLLGFDVSINRYTGLIITSDSSRIMIKFIACAFALALCSFIICFFSVHTMRYFKLTQMFNKPTHGSFAIAFPIILSIGLLAPYLTTLFSSGVEFFGIVLSNNYAYSIESTASATIFKIILALVFVSLEEIAFHGIILLSFRKFGDGFAIITSSLVYSLFQNGILEIISSFLISIVIGYFVVRSGSVYIAIIGRCSLILIYYIFAFMKLGLPEHIATAFIYLICIVIICIALIAFSAFSRHDKNSFVLRISDNTLSLRAKIARFSTTIFFLIFACLIVLQVIDDVQIIG